MDPIYLDYNATTPIDPEVAEAMLPFLTSHFGNPSSSHSYGVRTKRAVETARAQVAALLGCGTDEVVFTSGGTESNNLAIKGAALARRAAGRTVITSAVEHPAVVEPCRWLEREGFEVRVLPVDGRGLVDPAALEAAIDDRTTLVTVMHANNEVGTLQPIAALAEIAHRHGAWLHTDAAQSVGKVPVEVDALGADLLSVAGHKVYAAKGVGALFIRRGVELERLLHGADHERGWRPGTENVLEVVGLGAACALAGRDLDAEGLRLSALRDRLHAALSAGLGDDAVRLNGHPERRLPNTLSLSLSGVEASTLLAEVGDRVAASAGAACHTDHVSVSAVLDAMGVPLEWARGAVRLSVGRMTTASEIDEAARVLVEAVRPG